MRLAEKLRSSEKHAGGLWPLDICLGRQQQQPVRQKKMTVLKTHVGTAEGRESFGGVASSLKHEGSLDGGGGKRKRQVCIIQGGRRGGGELGRGCLVEGMPREGEAVVRQ